MADGSLYPATTAPASRRPRLLGEVAPPPEASDPFPVDLPPPPSAKAPAPPRAPRRTASAGATSPTIEHCRCCRCRGMAAPAAPALPSLSDDAQSRMCFGLLLVTATALYLYMAS